MSFLSKLQLLLTSGSDIRPAEAHTANTTGKTSEKRMKKSKDLSVISCDAIQPTGTSTVLVSQVLQVWAARVRFITELINGLSPQPCFTGDKFISSFLTVK